MATRDKQGWLRFWVGNSPGNGGRSPPEPPFPVPALRIPRIPRPRATLPARTMQMIVEEWERELIERIRYCSYKEIYLFPSTYLICFHYYKLFHFKTPPIFIYLFTIFLPLHHPTHQKLLSWSRRFPLLNSLLPIVSIFPSH